MFKPSLLIILLSFGTIAQGWQTKGKQKQDCAPGPKHMRTAVRHIEAGGIGYNKGYTTLEAFIASDPNQWRLMPFLDVRGHVFNDGKFAVNAGVGSRTIWGCRAYGMNVYYDYRNTHHRGYNQIAMGLETLGKLWDLRVNGYLPVGGKISRPYDRTFGGFQGNSLLVNRKFQYAMKGIDGEIGFHFGKTSNFDFYAASGPYYFKGEMGKGAIGGKVRVAGYYKEYVTLELSDSFDNVFHNNVQGQVTFTLPFGPKSRLKLTKKNCPDTCGNAATLATRMLQPVARQEIIVVDTKKKKQVAIDPETGEPYLFWFVNNTSHSAGTFESPFNTLVDAQNASSPNNVIYVYPGDRTSTGMDAGIILKDNQRLFGAGTNQTLPTTFGSITIPAQASAMPKIAVTGSVITCANNNEISGVQVVIDEGFITGVVCDSITNVLIHNNSFDGSAILSGDQFSGLLSLTSCSGEINVINNVFNIGNANLSSALFGVHMFSSGIGTSYLFKNNQFTAPIGNGSAGIEFGTMANAIGSFNTIVIAKNQFTGLGYDGMLGNDYGKGIGGYGFSGDGQITITQNIFSQTGAFGPPSNPSVVFIQVRGGNIVSTITNNTWENSLRPTETSVQVINNTLSSQSCVTLRNNVSDSSGFAYFLNNSAGTAGNFTANVQDNIGTVHETGTITVGSCP